MQGTLCKYSFHGSITHRSFLFLDLLDSCSCSCFSLGLLLLPPFVLACHPHLDPTIPFLLQLYASISVLHLLCHLLPQLLILLPSSIIIRSNSIPSLFPNLYTFFPIEPRSPLCNSNPQLLVSPNMCLQSYLPAELYQRNHTQAVIKKMSISPL